MIDLGGRNYQNLELLKGGTKMRKKCFVVLGIVCLLFGVMSLTGIYSNAIASNWYSPTPVISIPGYIPPVPAPSFFDVVNRANVESWKTWTEQMLKTGEDKDEYYAANLFYAIAGKDYLNYMGHFFVATVFGEVNNHNVISKPTLKGLYRQIYNVAKQKDNLRPACYILGQLMVRSDNNPQPVVVTNEDLIIKGGRECSLMLFSSLNKAYKSSILSAMIGFSIHGNPDTENTPNWRPNLRGVRLVTVLLLESNTDLDTKVGIFKDMEPLGMAAVLIDLDPQKQGQLFSGLAHYDNARFIVDIFDALIGYGNIALWQDWNGKDPNNPVVRTSGIKCVINFLENMSCEDAVTAQVNLKDSVSNKLFYGVAVETNHPEIAAQLLDTLFELQTITVQKADGAIAVIDCATYAKGIFTQLTLKHVPKAAETLLELWKIELRNSVQKGIVTPRVRALFNGIKSLNLNLAASLRVQLSYLRSMGRQLANLL